MMRAAVWPEMAAALSRDDTSRFASRRMLVEAIHALPSADVALIVAAELKASPDFTAEQAERLGREFSRHAWDLERT